MNGLRRGLILLGLTVAVIAGASIPASASYSSSVAVTTTIGTRAVAAPANFVGTLTCGHPTATMSATWALSSTPNVSGYLISVYFSDGFVQTVQLGPTATSWSKAITDYNVTAYTINYTVTTQTTYGWTKESAHTPTFGC
ncbi:MAG TPA: hypothetical protein VGN28_04525 [Blastococcus sp.]|jgi:hypothetical protein|nr:hypothetical protein [Blastococcus sp.]